MDMDNNSLTGRNNRLKFADLFLLCGYAAFIYWLSEQPKLYAPMWFAHQDKIYHAGAYSILALLTWRSLRHFIASPSGMALLTLLFCSFYGATDEWHQYYVAGRTADYTDWLADTAGAAVAVLVLFNNTKAKYDG